MGACARKFFHAIHILTAMKLFLKISLSFCLVLLAGFLVCLVYFFAVTTECTLSAEKLALSFSSVSVYDANGELMQQSSSSGTKQTVAFCDLPAHLPNAFVAVEDKRFYSHHGLEYGRMIKAALKNVASRSFREGASTISQQLIKNTHLSGEKTIKRKLKEIKLTKELENKYSKEEILELYLNSIYFGHSCFGLASATQFYFGKQANELLPAESAMLAALVKSPNRYSPFQDAEKCLKRRNFVLSLMKEQGYLSEKDYQTAVKTPLPASSSEEKEQNAYLSLVFAELGEIFPDANAEQMRNIRVYTAYEPELQTSLLNTSAESDYCYLIRDNHTNEICALESSCGLSARLPASTIKPLLVYAPALEEGEISPATAILDEQVNFNGYCPTNYGGTYCGYVSVRVALSKSINVPAVKILNEMGVKRAVSYLERMNLHVDEEDYSLALALGGMKKGFSLPALTDGYATFANGGNYVRARTIRKVLLEDGKEIYRRAQEPSPVFSDDTCALINDMLRTAVLEGTAKKLGGLPFQVCAKTGTGANASGNVDAYTIAYTTKHCVSAWHGNADNSPISSTGGGAPANAVERILRALYHAEPPADFFVPNSVVRVSLDKEEYENNHTLVRADQLSPPDCRMVELFSARYCPQTESARFSCPTIEKPTVSVKNGAVLINLCQTKYYDYLVKREHNGSIITIYSGKYQKTITDNSVLAGETYTYSVQPFYRERAGNTVVLPSVKLPATPPPQEDWWN